MPLSAGSKLGPYEVHSLLGAGGMGEVYRARDPRLGRDVAIKVLPPDLAGDENRRRRFFQEAHAASALNHPSIVSIHEMESADGVDFIVMEHVPGRTLDAVIRSGLRLGDALRIAVPVADALACAHAAGIVHRDLKPANVMVTPEGGVKVLDFGLAKLVEPTDASGEDETTLSEVERPSTLSRAGTIAGTPGYMSPEQATGGKVDARSDIFAFGALLYEMVTGRRAFTGATREDTLRAVVGQEAKPPSEVAPGVPADLEKLILRCLRKEPARRFQHMSDVKVELQEIKEESDSAVAAAKAATGRSHPRLWLAAGLAATAVVAVAGWLVWRSFGHALPPPRVVSLTTYRGSELQPALSPDGEQVAFSWEGEDDSASLRPPRHVYVKFVGGPDARQLTSGPGDDSYPSWSPDGRQVAFARETPPPVRPVVRAAYVISAQGGAERKLGDLPVRPSPFAWTPDGRGVVVARAGVGSAEDPTAGALHLLHLDGTAPATLSRPPRGGFHRSPAVSPDGHQLAYLELQDSSRSAPCYVLVVGLDATFRPSSSAERPRRIPAPAARGLTWAPDGRFVVVDGGRAARDLVASRRAEHRGASPDASNWPVGTPATIRVAPRARFVFARSPSMGLGALDGRRVTDPRSLVARQRPTELLSRRPADCLSSNRTGDACEIWLAEADGSKPVQLTHGPGWWQGSPRWSPDGRRIVFDSRAEGRYADVYVIEISGGPPRQVTAARWRKVAPAGRPTAASSTIDRIDPTAPTSGACPMRAARRNASRPAAASLL